MPARKPASLKVLEGRRGHRTKAELAREQSLARARPITPDEPEYLGEVGLRRWHELLAELEDMATLGYVDGDVLGGYCLAYQKLVAAEARLAADGPYVKRGTGGLARHPAAIDAENAARMMHTFGSELGIGAASRTRISIETPEADDGEDATMRAARIAGYRVP